MKLRSTPTTPRSARRGGPGRAPAAAVLALALTVVPFAGCGGDDPAEMPPPEEVAAPVAIAERSQLPLRMELQGSVTAAHTSAVAARVMATVTAVHVRAGDTVERGQPLLTIDPEAAQGQVSQARGALGQAQAGLALAERNFQRFQALSERQAASELELDMARTQLEQARGAVEQARGALTAASSVAADSRVVAPFAGRVVRRLVEVGDLAAPGRPLLMLESVGERRLGVAVPERLMARSGLAVGATVPVRIDAHPELGELQATVVEMAPGADPLAHTFHVELALPVAGIPTGTTGRAEISSGSREAVLVPAAAVVRRGGLDLVVVRTEEGLTASRVVTIGAPAPDGRVEVLSGLAGGETVLLGLGALPPAGSRVVAS